MLRRLPISLRFDDEDADFYYGFIVQKKNDRELSTLILDLLYAYYEEEAIRNLVDTYIFNKNPYIHIQNRLDEITLEHNKQMQSTGMLKDFTANEQKKASEPPKEDKEPDKPNNKEILALTETVERLVREIDDLKKGKIEINIEPEKEVITTQEPLISQKENNMESEVIEKPVIPKPTIVDSSEPLQERVEEPVSVVNLVVEEVEVVRKPASFGKLLNSVK